MECGIEARDLRDVWRDSRDDTDRCEVVWLVKRRQRCQLLQLVEDRIDLIRTDPAYDSLNTKYAGTENTIPGWSTLQRRTLLTRTRDSTAAGITDFYTVTVTVSGKGLRSGVRRTIVVGAP